MKYLILLTLFVIVLAGMDNADALEFKTVWTDQFGSSGNDVIHGVTNSNGNIAVAGYTVGSLFGTNAGGYDGFVRMYNASGAVLWSDQFGSSASDHIMAATTSNGNIAVAGYTDGSLFGTNPGGHDGFVRVYNTSGTVLWSNQFGTAANDVIKDATTSNGNIVVAGYTVGSLFGTNAGGNDGFVRVYNSTGTVLWSDQFGTNSGDWIDDVTNSNGNIVVVGETKGSLFGTNAGGYDGFIRVYNSTGTVLWSDQFGSSNYDSIRSVTNSNGNIVVVGETYGSLFGTNADESDGFIRVYNASGTVLWGDQFGSSNADEITAVTVDSNGNIAIAGYTYGSLFGTNAGGYDGFIRVYNSTGTVLRTDQFGSSGNDMVHTATTSNGNIVVAGDTDGSLYGTNAGGHDGFVRTLFILDSVPTTTTSLIATPLKSTEMSLTWSAPTINGGSTITGYQVDYKKSSVTSWVNAYTVTDLYATPAGLTNGESYDFRVAAINAKGIGANATITATPITPGYIDAFSVTPQDATPRGITFSSDGLHMFVLGNNNNKVFSYELSSAFDVSTSTYNNSFSVAAQDTNLIDIKFSVDGKTMFMVGHDNDKVSQYSLSTSYDITTASFTGEFSVATQDKAPRGLAFSTDGLNMYVVGNKHNKVSQYSLSTAYNVTTATFTKDNSVFADTPTGLAFSSDGTKMFVLFNHSVKVIAYNLSTANDVATSNYAAAYYLNEQTWDARGIAFSSDGLKMFISASDNDNILEYLLPGAYSFD